MTSSKEFLYQLPQRQELSRRLQNLISEGETPLFLLMLDLSGFHPVYAELKIQKAEELVAEVAVRLSQAIENNEVMGWMRGDDFALIKRGNHDEVQGLIQRLLSCFDSEFIFDSQKYQLNADIGVAEFPKDAVSPQQLFQKASIAMSESKQSPNQNYQYFS